MVSNPSDEADRSRSEMVGWKWRDVMSSEWVEVCEKIGTVGLLASQKCIEASSPFKTVPVAIV